MIVLLCLILFGMLQLSIVTAAHDVNIYAASCGARCAAVGYDDDMIEKAIRVAALPNMGARPGMGIYAEKTAARDYLLTQDAGALSYVDSEYWDSLSGVDANMGADVVRVELLQRYPLAIPFVRAFSPDYEVDLNSEEVRMMNHAGLYLGNN